MTALKWDVEHDLNRLGPEAVGGREAATARPPSFRRLREPRVLRRRRSGPVNPLRWAVLCTAFPAVLLVFYVALWTVAMHTGYRNQVIRERIAQIEIENNSLRAQMRKLQSPRRIHYHAAKMGMQPSEQVGYIFVPE